VYARQADDATVAVLPPRAPLMGLADLQVGALSKAAEQAKNGAEANARGV
jgi:hypothetical protein